ncbi:MAG: TonB-dependent receptor plug domain-containing protein [Bacteroidales bacterium]
MFLLLSVNPAFSQQRRDNISEKILEGLEIMEYSYPGQKVFIDTDKDEYLAGETIWLKAYVVNATTLRPDTLSTNFHVELFNAHDDMVSLLFMRLKNGFAHGDITLPDSLSEGSYRMKAYTDWMHNFDKQLFFSKDIHVSNPIEENFIKLWDVWKNRWFNRKLENTRESMQFAFFPEGGHMLAGHENRVAFKAANELGGPVEATGVLLDEAGNELLEFSSFHNGMGAFTFSPEPDTDYTAEITFANGEQEEFSLPDIENTGYLLTADNRDDHIHVSVKSNQEQTLATDDESVYLLAQARGREVFLENKVLEGNGLSVSIPTGEMPTGICQIVLFSDEGIPLAERMVFVNHGDIHEANIVHADLQDNTEQQSVSLELAIDDHVNNGNYSLTVLDTDEGSHNPRRSNIATNLFITGDIGETIKDPWYYLHHAGSEEVEKATDLLMMTHGWRRFDWDNIMERSFPEISYGFPKGITIAGVVSPRSSARQTGEVDVELAVSHEGVDIYSTTTDSEGAFSFSNLEYYGNFTAKLRIEQFARPRDLRADLNFRDTEQIEYGNNFHTSPFQVTSRGDDWERTSRPETTFSSQKLLEPSQQDVSMFKDPDQVIFFNDIRDQHNSIMDVLRTRVRGLRIIGNEIVLRGQSSFRVTNEPLFLVDEVPVNRNTFLNVSVNNIDRLEVMTGPSTAILGKRGANGALLIYTKRGDAHRHGTYEYFMQGFHIPSETFESKINTDTYTQHDISRTLFWEPYAQPDENNRIRVSFPSDEYTRDLRVIIQGIDENGEIIFSDKPIDAL